MKATQTTIFHGQTFFAGEDLPEDYEAMSKPNSARARMMGHKSVDTSGEGRPGVSASGAKQIADQVNVDGQATAISEAERKAMETATPTIGGSATPLRGKTAAGATNPDKK